ncbi:MAG: glycosyltransferase, partial [Planctomycetota bacterium]|nr:glycosyltransferase [Planctomycetota bacterium]
MPVGSAELGGSQLFLLRLYEALASEQWHFSFWLFSVGPLAAELRQRQAEVRIFPRLWLRTPWGLGRLEREIMAWQPDVIYLHASRALAWLAKRCGIPCVERINMSRGAGAGGWCAWPGVDRICTNW